MPTWKSISTRVRRHRAGNTCECSGQCGSHRCLGPKIGRCGASNFEPHPVTEEATRLVVRRLDRNPDNVDWSNLIVWCQLCDEVYHADERRQARAKAEQDQGHDTLFDLTA